VANEASAPAASAPDLAPIELYTADSRIVGWVAPNGQRITDLLVTRDELRLWRPSPGPLDATEMPLAHGEPEDRGAAGANGDWEGVATARVILAMPPEWRASRQLRLHRRLRRAVILAGPFRVTGNVHLPPGGDIGPHLLRSQRFLPLTDAYILHEGEPPFEHVVSVVIVNTAHATNVAPLVTLA